MILSRFKFVNGTRPGVISYPVISSRKILYVGLESVNCRYSLVFESNFPTRDEFHDASLNASPLTFKSGVGIVDEHEDSR